MNDDEMFETVGSVEYNDWSSGTDLTLYLYSCKICGAMTENTQLHQNWHQQQEAK